VLARSKFLHPPLDSDHTHLLARLRRGGQTQNAANSAGNPEKMDRIATTSLLPPRHSFSRPLHESAPSHTLQGATPVFNRENAPVCTVYWTPKLYIPSLPPCVGSPWMLGTNGIVESFLCLRLANTSTPLPSRQGFTGRFGKGLIECENRLPRNSTISLQRYHRTLVQTSSCVKVRASRYPLIGQVSEQFPTSLLTTSLSIYMHSQHPN
jgi:hypothetical protein